MANRTYIKVYWDDILDNYNRVNELKIQRYFEKKYDARVNVVFRAIQNASTKDMEGLEADATDQVTDPIYQRKLIKKYIKDNEIKINWDHLMKLDDNVNAKIDASTEMNTRHKKIEINEITINNFLSYADVDQTFELKKYKGLSIIRSEPQNKAGKTSGIVDALMFVFFGKTTKTDTLSDVFNTYTDTNKVSVKAAIGIDGDEYMIERIVTRTPKRDKSGYTVKSNVEFFTPLADGTWQNLKGEKRQSTDKIITEYIGNYDDFLLTIITTIKNFYSLVDSKPTERGKIFTRFIGVEHLTDKAEIAKKMQSDWIKTSKLNRTNSETLDGQIDEENITLQGYKDLAGITQGELDAVNGEITIKEKDIEIITLKKHQNVDEDMYKIQESDILEGIGKLTATITNKTVSIGELKVKLIAPKTNFDIDVYNSDRGELQPLINSLTTAKTKKSMAESSITQLISGETCPTCNQALKGVDHTKEIAAKKTGVEAFIVEINRLTKESGEVQIKVDAHEAIKDAWTVHDKADLVIQRNEVELDVFKKNLIVGEEKLAKYRKNKVFIEANRQIDTQISVLNNQLKIKNNDREEKLLTLKGYEKDIENADKRISQFKETKKEIVKDEIINKIYFVYGVIFGKNGISKMILGAMIPIINSYLNQMMFDTVPFKLIIKLNDKNEVEFWMVDDEGDVEKKLISGSGYESTISLLALRCVLSKVCSLPKPNLIVFDEVFGQIADENMPLLGAFFERMKEYFDSMFVITHNPMMLDWADNIINIKKNNNLTYLLNNESKKK